MGLAVKNREQYYQNQLAAFAGVDLAGQAQALGLSLNQNGQVPLRFFGRDYLVDAGEGVRPDGHQSLTQDHKSIIMHYLMSKWRGGETGEFLPIGRLTGLVDTGRSPSDDLIAPLAQRFGERYALFAVAADKIGGTFMGSAPSGGWLWQFRPLPKLPLQVVFFEADDEFPAEVKVLFDSSAANLVSYECLELLEIVLVVELLAAAGLLGCGGHHHGEGEECGCGGDCGDCGGQE